MCQRWPLDLDLLHFEIGDGGQQLRVPVDQPLVLVDQALVVELTNTLSTASRQPLVHGEALARPVAGRAEPLELLDDGAAASPPSRPRPARETSRAPSRGGRAPGAPSTAARPPSAWRCRRGRCRAATARRARASARSGQDVLQRVVERVAHMQRAGDVRRRDDDAVRLQRPRARAGRRGRRRPPPTPRRCGLRLRRADMSCRSCGICIVL